MSSPDASPFLRVAPDPTRSAEAGAVAPDLTVLVPVLDEADSVDELAARVTAVARDAGTLVRDRVRRRRLARRHRRPRARRSPPRPAGQDGAAAPQLRQGGGAVRRLRPLPRPPGGHHGRRSPGRSRRDPPAARSARVEGPRPGVGLEAAAQRSRLEALAVAPLQLGHAARGAGSAPRLQLRLQGLSARGARAGLDLRRAPPLHPGARQPPRLSRRRDRGAPPSAPARRFEVRLGPPLQGAARPDHRALHHQVHAAAAPPLRRLRPDLPRARLRHQPLSRDPVVPGCSRSPTVRCCCSACC